MIRSGLMMYLLQKHHTASKAGQVLKLSSKGLGERMVLLFLPSTTSPAL